MTIDAKIDDLVETFAQDLQTLVRQQVTESILNAVGAGSAPRKLSHKKASPSKKVKGAARKRASKKAKKGGRIRRSPEQMAQLQSSILSTLKKGPARSEALAETIGVAVKELHTPLKKLIEEKKLKSKGTTRAKEYRIA